MRDLPEVQNALMLNKTAKKQGLTQKGIGTPEITPFQVFGIPLTDVLALSNHQGCQLPLVVTSTVEFIDRYGLDSEGIFRISAMASVLDDVKRRFNRGEIVDFAAVQGQEDVAAGILKLWLRELPEPVILFSLYPAFCAAHGIQSSFSTNITAFRATK